MKIRVLACGRLKERYFEAAQAEYEKRLRRYCSLEITEVKSDRALAAALPKDAILYALDERGEMLSSGQFAAALAADERAARPVIFAIGGPDGHSESVRQQADKLIAFGRATIAHRLVRIVLLEQIYRAFRINRGEPYHRD